MTSLDAIKGPDPLTDNWTYDSAIDLFSWNPMMPDPFTFDLPDDLMNFESKDLSAGMVAPSDISGFVIGNHMGEDAASISDPESDDHPWSPSAHAAFPELSPVTSTEQVHQETARYSTTPDATSPQEQPSSPPTRSTRRRSSADGPVRNAAKRAAHNVIEKRYRTNMNAKFVALEKAMNGDNGVQKSSRGGCSASLKKSEILSNAIAYMHGLQEENRYLQKELAIVKQNLVPAGVWRGAPSCKRETSYR